MQEVNGETTCQGKNGFQERRKDQTHMEFCKVEIIVKTICTFIAEIINKHFIF